MGQAALQAVSVAGGGRRRLRPPDIGERAAAAVGQGHLRGADRGAHSHLQLRGQQNEV